MILTEKLKDIGLSKNEIKIYVHLLETGGGTPPQIAKAVKIQRPNTYQILEKLKKRGLIEEIKKGKRKAYNPTDPLSLVSQLERQKQKAENLLPDLRALYKEQQNKPVIKFYDGYDQVSQLIFELIEKAPEEIYFIGSTNKLHSLSVDDFAAYENKIWKKKVFLYDLLTAESSLKTADESKQRMRGYYQAYKLPEKYKDLPTSIIISGDSVGLLSLEKPYFATQVVNKNLSDSFKMLFNVAVLASEKV